ncbi:MAG: glycosyltransferase family 2 protein [Deltaproteobacteria bacterium]|nr:glycosyltransferase family 2 protein [Deltaproteobacteria bacterium]
MSLSSKHDRKYPPVSVIILTFNGGEYISQLLQSLENQTYPGDLVEIIVVDNASTDDTVGIIQRSHPSVNLVLLKKNIGFAAGNNKGLRFASHDILVFLNQDTVCHSEFLISLVDVMIKDTTLAACNPNIIVPDPADFTKVDSLFPPKSLHVCNLSPFGYGQNRMIHGQAIYYPKLLSGCAFIIRRETISKLGYLFDDQLWMYAEDTDLSLRMYNQGQKIGAARDAVIFHLHSSNMGFTKSRLLLAGQAVKNRLFVFYKNMDMLEFLFFFPLLFLGGVFKIFELPLTTAKKAIYFLPFSLFSMICMILAVLQLPGFAAQKRINKKKRRIPGFSILKLLLTRSI